MNGDIMLLARLYKSNTEEAIEWIRSHPKDKSADITSKVKKIYYGYGGRGAGNSEYNIEIKSDGIYICNGEGADTNKYTYSAIVRELGTYMESESCDQLEVKQDKQPPSERIEEVAATFNYAVLSAELGEYLRHKEEQLKNEYMNFTANCGRIFAEAQERLAKHGFGENNGVFEKWIASMGFKKSTVYEMIKIHQFRSSEIRTNEQAQLFDGLSKSLQYEIAKSSAPPELVEQVMNGDITTHKEYIALKKELEAAEEHNSVLTAEKEQFQKASKANFEKLSEERERNAELKKQLAEAKESLDTSEDFIRKAEERAEYAENKVTEISVKKYELEKRVKELESRPIDVAVDVDEVNRRVEEVLQKVNSENAHLLAEERSEFAKTINAKDDKIWELEDKLKALEDKPQKYVKKIFAFAMTMDTYSKLIELIKKSKDTDLSKALSGAKIIDLNGKEV